MQCAFVAEGRSVRSLPGDPVPEIAFAGRSNVGKSTLLNCVSQRHGLARTSRTPGCTRGLVMFSLTLRNGRQFHLMDLPGYGFADRARDEKTSWGSMIEGYLEARAQLRAVAILVDVRRGPEQEETQLAEYLNSIRREWFIVLTKADKLSKAERIPRLRAIAEQLQTSPGRILLVSGETSEGRPELMRRMQSLLFPTQQND